MDTRLYRPVRLTQLLGATCWPLPRTAQDRSLLRKYPEDGISYLDYNFKEEQEYSDLFMCTIRDNNIIIAHNHSYYALGQSSSWAFFHAFYPCQELGTG